MSDQDAQDLALARRHAPIIYFDTREPFLPQQVGYAVLRQSGPSPTFDGYLSFTPEVGGLAGFRAGQRIEGVSAVIEYALWTDWDIQHLYELEHVWSYVDHQGNLLYAEASWHGGRGALYQGGRLAAERARPIAYAQPGKHAMAPDPGVFFTYDVARDQFTRPAGPQAGRNGLLVGRPIAGRIEKNARRDALANSFLRRHAFDPTFDFSIRWDARDVPLLPCDRLIAGIPARLEQVLRHLEAERATRQIWAVCFDLGDTLMVEETEEKDGERTTHRADLFPGASDLLWDLRRQGYLLGLIADTRPGTYRNVLRQHGVYDAFDTFAISEELGCEKPDPRMFHAMLERFGLRPDEAGHVLMIGNNLARDVRGANQAGLRSLWLRFNERYPLTGATPEETPHEQARSYDGVRQVLARLG